MALMNGNIVWILFTVVLVLSVLQTDARRGGSRSYRSSRSSGGTSSGGELIALIVVGSIFVVLGLVVLIRCIWAKKHGTPFWSCEPNKTKPVDDVTTSYPTGQAEPPPPYSDPVYPPPKY